MSGSERQLAPFVSEQQSENEHDACAQGCIPLNEPNQLSMPTAHFLLEIRSCVVSWFHCSRKNATRKEPGDSQKTSSPRRLSFVVSSEKTIEWLKLGLERQAMFDGIRCSQKSVVRAISLGACLLARTHDGLVNSGTFRQHRTSGM